MGKESMLPPLEKESDVAARERIASESPVGWHETEEHRIERERQKIRDEAARYRAEAQVVRDAANKIMENIRLGGGEYGDEESLRREHESLLKQVAGIEAEANRIEMTIRNVK